jgi:hypothetical protein
MALDVVDEVVPHHRAGGAAERVDPGEVGREPLADVVEVTVPLS